MWSPKTLIVILIVVVISTLTVLVDSQSQADWNSLLKRDRFRSYRPRGRMTCDKYPSVCQVKGSPGPHCCKKKCVNVLKDKLNCGKCGKKCKYSQMCCKGKCVNVMSSEKHCGRCGNSCEKGSNCTYGLCSYAG